jgi:ABC-2 type transport system ATP-binding protein
LSILTTLLIPTAGSAHVGGYDVVTEPAQVRRCIGVTFQETVLDQQLTGRQILQFHGRLYGMPTSELKRGIAELSELVDLTAALDRKVLGYSGGMKRRLELIRGLLTKPDILFLDEPTQGLDPHNRLGIWQYLSRLRQEFPLTILLTTHYMDEAETLADRVGIFTQGQLAREGTPAELSAELGDDVIVLTGSGPLDAFAQRLSRADWVQRWTRHTTRAIPAQAPNTELDDTQLDGTQLNNTETSASYVAQDNDAQHTFQIGVENGGRYLAQIVSLATESDIQIQELTVNRPTLADVFLAVTGSILPKDTP